MPRVSVSYLVGLPQSHNWSHAGVVECAKQTTLVFNLSLQGDRANQLGQALVQKFEALSLTSAAELYGFLQQVIEQTTRQGAQISLAAALVSVSQLIVATWWGSLVLRRSGVTSRLLTSANQIGILEGDLVSGDVLVLCTQGAQRYQTELCQRLADGFEPEVVRQALSTEVVADSQAANIAMTFVTTQSVVSPLPAELEPVAKAEPVAGSSPVAEKSSADSAVRTVEPVVTQTSPQLSLSPAPDLQHKTQPRLSQLIRGLKLLTQLIGLILKKLVAVFQLILRFRPQNLQLSLKQLGQNLRWWWQVLTGKRVYLSTAKNKPRRIIILAVMAGLFCVIVVLTLWWWRGQAKAQAELAPFVASRENIESLLSSDIFQARTSALSLRTELSRQATASGLSRSTRNLTNQELAKVDKILLDLTKKTELQELPVYLDLDTVQPGFLTELSAASGASQAALLDVGQKQLIQLNLADKSQKVTPLSLSSTPVSLTMVSQDIPVVLADGLWTLKADPAQKLVELGDSNREATLLASFDETLYVFNPVKRNIFRYTKTKDGYSKPVGWLIEPLGVEFTDVVSMSVDDQVWLGSKQGEVKLFKAGRAQSFTIQGLAQPLTHPIVLATHASTPDLYILDSPASRVVIVDKTTGQVKREIVSISLKSASNLLVSSHGVFAVSGSLIYQLPD